MHRHDCTMIKLHNKIIPGTS